MKNYDNAPITAETLTQEEQHEREEISEKKAHKFGEKALQLFQKLTGFMRKKAPNETIDTEKNVEKIEEEALTPEEEWARELELQDPSFFGGNIRDIEDFCFKKILAKDYGMEKTANIGPSSPAILKDQVRIFSNCHSKKTVSAPSLITFLRENRTGNEATDAKVMRELEKASESFIKNPNEDQESALNMLSLVAETARDEHESNLNRTSLIRRYAENFGFETTKSEKEEIRSIMRHIDEGDPDFTIIADVDARGGWPRSDGYTHEQKIGLCHFACETVRRKATPENIQYLMEYESELGTGGQNYHEARTIAIRLYGNDKIFKGREFIHDNRPGASELLQTMLAYYDNDDEEQASRLAERVNDVLSKHKDLAEFVPGNWQDKGHIRDFEDQISQLRRLTEIFDNTKIEMPQTSDEKLDEMMKAIESKKSENGNWYVRLKDMQEIMTYINSDIAKREASGKTDVMTPSYIRALRYIEQAAQQALRNVDKDEIGQLFWDPSFKEIVRFNEMTCSAEEYSEQGFESFWRNFSNIEMDASPTLVQGKYKQLATRILGHIQPLAEKYNQEGETERADSIWSGNLTHDLISLQENV